MMLRQIYIAAALVLLAAACSHVDCKPSGTNGLINKRQNIVPDVFTDLKHAYKAVLDFFHSKAVEIGDYIDDGDFGEALAVLAQVNGQAGKATEDFYEATEQLNEIQETLENAGVHLQDAMAQAQQEVSNNLAPIVNSDGTGDVPPPPSPSSSEENETEPSNDEGPSPSNDEGPPPPDDEGRPPPNDEGPPPPNDEGPPPSNDEGPPPPNDEGPPPPNDEGLPPPNDEGPPPPNDEGPPPSNDEGPPPPNDEGPPPPNDEGPPPPSDDGPPPPNDEGPLPPPPPERSVIGKYSMGKSTSGRTGHTHKTASLRSHFADTISIKRKLELLDVLRRLQQIEDM